VFAVNMVVKFGGIRRRILFICNMHLRLQQSPIFKRTARIINNMKTAVMENRPLHHLLEIQ
jgi:hypothetical protein